MEAMAVGGEDESHETVKKIRSIFGSDLSEPDILRAVSQCGNNPDAAINYILDTPGLLLPPMEVKRTVTSTGSRVSAQIKVTSGEELEKSESVDGLKPMVTEKSESDCIHKPAPKMSFDEFLQATNTKVTADDEYLNTQIEKKEESGKSESGDGLKPMVTEKSESGCIHKSAPKMSFDEFLQATNTKVMADDEYLKTLIKQEAEEGESVCGSKADEREKEVLEKFESVDELKLKLKKKEESGSSGCILKPAPKMSFNKFLHATNTEVMADAEYMKTQIKKESEEGKSDCGLKGNEKVKKEIDLGLEKKEPVKEETEPLITKGVTFQEYIRLVEKPKESKTEPNCGSKAGIQFKEKPDLGFENKVSAKQFDESKSHTSRRPDHMQKPSYVKKERVEDTSLSNVVIEDGDFPEEPNWLLLGRTMVTGLSTTKGRKLENNEIVHFAFPRADTNSRQSSYWVSSRAAAASSGIVRFSTKRSGEIGRLPMEWSKCLIPLVNSTKVKVLGRCIAAPVNLHMMQEILLYVSFYIHKSIFLERDKSSWRLDSPSNIDSTVYPLLTLFKLLKNKPFQEAEFTPEEIDSRKRSLNLEGDSGEATSMLPIVKRRKGCQQYPEQYKDEQAISESSLNTLVGAADMYYLEEMEPPETLMCDLWPYQKQALYWMSELEKGVDVEKAEKTLHPCWAAYRICDGRATSIYVNIFSGEATTQFPTAMQMARGGILADAMGLGKTVMTIALILARPGRCLDNQKVISETTNGAEYTKKKKEDSVKVPSKVNGGTLIICPMALLSQWKDELDTHSKPETISIFVHYGGDRTNDPKAIAEHAVVLTTYGVLTSSYKKDGEISIFHKIEWYRVVLDEAHTIKSSKTQVAQAAFSLSSHCRWCLTGTPLQNNLEDLYSLLCFLHVEPWCNWAWWSKLIQRPYESGDQRGLRLVKAILRPLMLRRTKETKDKEGRPILELPPTDIQVIECEQSEAEHDFYGALFKRSKVQFDQFVAQGKVLHNYANILELLLRLRQCCNHPFLVMSRGDSQVYADLNKLARRFLETNPDYANPSQKAPTRAYVEEVVESIRRGDNTECPICLESADDPVLTPCAHRMCRECLLSSWRTPSTGLCPICRQLLKKSDLITCPSENHFRIDVEKNWKESSKVTKLLDCLENIRKSGSGEKSIVFSQWTSFLNLLEIPLRRRKIGFLRFDGRLVQKQRALVLKEFNETREKMVLLMSLRAGGVGLNLTAACNVFLMDPWWNPAVEEQAIMRIHRIGQKQTVSVRRFIVKDTVEERMQQVQARKQRMIAGALTDEEVRSVRLEELKMLFR